MPRLFPSSRMIQRLRLLTLRSPSTQSSWSSMTTPGTPQGYPTQAAPPPTSAQTAHHHSAVGSHSVDEAGGGPGQPVPALIAPVEATYGTVVMAWQSANEFRSLTSGLHWGSDGQPQAWDINAPFTCLPGPGQGSAPPTYWNRQRWEHSLSNLRA